MLFIKNNVRIIYFFFKCCPDRDMFFGHLIRYFFLSQKWPLGKIFIKVVVHRSKQYVSTYILSTQSKNSYAGTYFAGTFESNILTISPGSPGML